MIKAGICAIVKNEGPYLLEWLQHHVAIGVERFYVFDNDSTDNTADILIKFGDRCRHFRIPDETGKKAQPRAYGLGLQAARGECEWICYLDADEFLNLKRHRSISEFLEDYEDVDAVGINWRVFGDSGLVVNDGRPLRERFTLASSRTFGANHLVKTIAKVNSIVEPGIHTHTLIEGGVFVDTAKSPLKQAPACRQDVVRWDVAQINHYFGKTREEWATKRSRGKADFPPDHPNRIRNDQEFEAHNRNDEEDLSIQRWTPGP